MSGVPWRSRADQIEKCDELIADMSSEIDDLNEAIKHVILAKRKLQGQVVTEETDDTSEDEPAARWDDPDTETSEDPKEEPLPDDPISVKGRKASTQYKNLTMRTAITNCLGRAGKPVTAATVHEMLNAGGKAVSLAAVRAALSALRHDINTVKIAMPSLGRHGPKKVTHYSLKPISELVE